MLDISARHKKTREKCCSPNISNGRRLTTGLERNAALLILELAMIATPPSTLPSPPLVLCGRGRVSSSAKLPPPPLPRLLPNLGRTLCAHNYLFSFQPSWLLSSHPL